MENHRPPSHIAVIDLGSNTARLAIMAYVPGYCYRQIDEIREVVRLRQGMTPEGLSPEAIERAISTLRLFKRFCDSTQADTVLATATSAVREADNGPEFIERVRAEIGLCLRILSGRDEAFYGAIGALNEVPIDNGYVLDIGGGSAQISRVQSGRFHEGGALTLGALALSERFITGDRITDVEFASVQEEIERQLDTSSWVKKLNSSTLVGLGGTIRNLANMEAKRQDYPLNTLHGFALSRRSVEESIDLVRTLSLSKRQKIPGLSNDRADIILPGAMVALGVLKRSGAKEMIVSTSGLREGIFFEQFWQHLPYPVIPDVRRFSVLNVARLYNYQKAHASHVRFLAGRLFDQLRELHGFGAAERELLEAAALLHDVGTIIRYNDHHKHSQTLIDYNGLPGFSPREIALIGLLARYHRKGTPHISNFEPLLSDADRPVLLSLAAILRLAEFLERGRNAAVDDVIVTWSDEELRLTLIADDHPAVELWEAERNAAPLVKTAFGRAVLLDSIAAPGEWRAAAEQQTEEAPPHLRAS